jgi:hypothetical protein
LKYDNSSEIGMMLGCFDRADLLAPAYHYAAESRLPWLEVSDGLAPQTPEASESELPSSAPA